MASSNPMSPSKNPLSSWLRLRRKSDSINDNNTFDTNSGSAPNANGNTNGNRNSNRNGGTGVNSNGIVAHSSQKTQDQQFLQEDDIKKFTNGTQPLNDTSQSSSILHAPIPLKSRSRKSSNAISINMMSPQKSSTPQHSQNQQLSSSPTPSRPFLGFKSKSSHSFRPLSQFLDSTSNFGLNQQQIQSSNDNSSSPTHSNEKLRSHRDSFLQQRQLDITGDSQIFGCDIETSTNNASGKIYISSVSSNTKNEKDSDDLSVEYGKAPLVIIQCGSYLKQNALNVEGIFRLAGSNKRIKELQIIFSSPPNYGSKINWDGYTVHDAASLLRRYLSSLSEPLIPLKFYDSFRNKLIEKPECIQFLKIMDNKDSVKLFKSDKEKYTKCVHQRRKLLKEYAILIQRLPPIQKRVLFYLLDLLAQFNLHSNKNRMPAKNLAAIFQPSILFHPSHDMNPDEYAINSLVIESMITYSHKILAQFHNHYLTDDKKSEDSIENFSEKQNHSMSNSRSDLDSSNNISSSEINQISEEDDEVNVEDNGDSDILSKPTLLLDHPDDSSLKYSKKYNSSPMKGSPLKNMISQTPQLVINDLEAPKSIFSSPKKERSRPYSKSFSLVPHAEIVRITAPVKLFVNKNESTNSEDNLSRVLSNQSAMSSLLSSKLNYDNKDSVDNIMGTESNLAKELGLSDPTTEINNNSMENIGSDHSLNSQTNFSNNAKNNIINQIIVDSNSNIEKTYDFPPVTPTSESTVLRARTPNAEIIDRPDHQNVYMDDFISRDDNQKNLQNDDQNGEQNDEQNYEQNDDKSESCLLYKKQSTVAPTVTSNSIADSPRRSTTSLAFSFQPSLLQGHVSNENSQSSIINEVNVKDDNKSLNDQIPNKIKIVKKNTQLVDHGSLNPSNPDISNNPPLHLKTAITPTSESFTASDKNDEVDQIPVKKRSNENNDANRDQAEIRSSSLFTFSSSHKINLNLSRNTSNSSEVSEKSPTESSEKSKEKRNWFEKLKPRSTPKR